MLNEVEYTIDDVLSLSEGLDTSKVDSYYELKELFAKSPKDGMNFECFVEGISNLEDWRRDCVSYLELSDKESGKTFIKNVILPQLEEVTDLYKNVIDIMAHEYDLRDHSHLVKD